MENAIKMTKSGKAARHDNVVTELFKTDLKERVHELTKLFNKVKEEGIAPRCLNRTDSKLSYPSRVTYVSVQIGRE